MVVGAKVKAAAAGRTALFDAGSEMAVLIMILLCIILLYIVSEWKSVSPWLT
jgi:hypothetical protein